MECDVSLGARYDLGLEIGCDVGLDTGTILGFKLGIAFSVVNLPGLVVDEVL